MYCIDHRFNGLTIFIQLQNVTIIKCANFAHPHESAN